ncbi:MAG: hypothetical protein ACOYXT_11575 [Bacteroidota bacterium]
MSDIKEKIIPPQYVGGKKDVEHAQQAADEESARQLFMIARNRLLDINHWNEFSGSISANFSLTDHGGNTVTRTAEKGDYFKIDLPAPGPREGEGYDWVFIEAIEEKSDSAGSYESTAMRVRPAPNPQKKGENVAHFFKDDATSSFVVERRCTLVTAGVHGRNEIPNTATSDVADKVRNAVVGTTAILGLANIQWNNLAKGLIATS